MNNLPKVVLVEILKNLPYDNIINLCKTSKKCWIICKDQYFWKIKFQYTFLKYYKDELNIVDWKEYYVDHMNICYIYGNNQYGEIGIDRDVNTNILLGVKNIFCANGNTIIINNKNQLFGCGLNEQYQLGMEKKHIIQFTFIMNNVKMCSIGWKHGAIITNNDELYMVGDNLYGELCNNTTQSNKTYQLVLENVKKVECGHHSSIILRTNGYCYFYGEKHEKGILLRNDVNDIDCGWRSYGMITNIGDLYVNVNNYKYDDIDKFKFISNNIRKFSMSEYFYCYITKNDELYIRGTWTKLKIDSVCKLIDTNIKNVYCGDHHAFYIKNNGDLCAFGSNEEKQILLYKNSKWISTNHPILLDKNVKYISCGYRVSSYIKSNEII